MGAATADAEPLDRLSDLFAGDPLLSSQFNDLRRRSVTITFEPVLRLMVAVLADGIASLSVAGGSVSRQCLRAEADRWIFEDCSAVPFSFVWICDGLGIDPYYLRAGVRRIKAKMAPQLGFKHPAGGI
jgi:hypothetical protein